MRIDLDNIVMLAGAIGTYLVATRKLGARAGDPTYEHFVARFAKPLKISSIVVGAFVVLKVMLSVFL